MVPKNISLIHSKCYIINFDVRVVELLFTDMWKMYCSTPLFWFFQIFSISCMDILYFFVDYSLRFASPWQTEGAETRLVDLRYSVLLRLDLLYYMKHFKNFINIIFYPLLYIILHNEHDKVKHEVNYEHEDSCSLCIILLRLILQN